MRTPAASEPPPSLHLRCLFLISPNDIVITSVFSNCALRLRVILLGIYRFYNIIVYVLEQDPGLARGIEQRNGVLSQDRGSAGDFGKSGVNPNHKM